MIMRPDRAGPHAQRQRALHLSVTQRAMGIFQQMQGLRLCKAYSGRARPVHRAYTGTAVCTGYLENSVNSCV